YVLLAVEWLDTDGFAVACETDLLDLVFSRLEQAIAMRLERLAALVNPDRLVQRHIATFEIVDNALQRLQRLFEGHELDVVVDRRRLGHGLSFHQAAHMRAYRKSQPMKVVSAFKNAHQPSSGPAMRPLHQLRRRPIEILLDEVDLSKRIAVVSVET